MRLIKRKPVNVVEKKWGREIWAVNNEKYCGKLLYFNKGAQFSTHLHDVKEESWMIQSGKLKLTLIDTADASKYEIILDKDDCIDIPRLVPHRLEALEDSVVFETSTFHSDGDSFRVEPGDSQKSVESPYGHKIQTGTYYGDINISSVGGNSNIGCGFISPGYQGEPMPNPTHVGRKVKVVKGSHVGKGGTVTCHWPNGDDCSGNYNQQLYALNGERHHNNSYGINVKDCEFIDEPPTNLDSLLGLVREKAKTLNFNTELLSLLNSEAMQKFVMDGLEKAYKGTNLEHQICPKCKRFYVFCKGHDNH